jgi:FAD/FMN-containing dehydrogenase
MVMRYTNTDDSVGTRDIGRRDFVKAAAAGVLAGWLPAFRVSPASARATCAAPPNFPGSITLYQQAYQNWSGEIQIAALWTCAPRTPADVLTVVNWAYANGYQVRPRGMMHNWSPLTVPPSATCGSKVVLLDTTQYLTAVSINTTNNTVTAQTGITMEALLTALEGAGLGVTATPAPGDVTLGGVLAIDGHGTAVPAVGEQALAGHTYGSLSNLVLSLTAVVWNPASGQYVLRTYQRSDARCKAFLVHLGRTFITEVTLQVGANQRLRCQSWFNIPATQLFGPAGSSGNTLSSYLDSAGRVEAIWFPFTANPWLKVWSVTPSKPLLSLEVTSPYNYSFSDTVTTAEAQLVAQILGGNPASVTSFGPLQYDLVAAGLVVTFTYDIWGWSKNLLLYVRPTTLRVTANGYAVLTSRANVQQVVNDFFTAHQARVAAYQAVGNYPMNGPVEIRVTGLDNPADIGLPGAGAAQLSALRPRPDQSAWNVAVWFDILTIPGTPTAEQFYRETEQWMISHYSGSYAMVRPEWSKGWAYTTSAAWSDPTMLTTTIPNAYRTGQATGDDWDAALATLDACDPHRVFASPLLNSLAP